MIAGILKVSPLTPTGSGWSVELGSAEQPFLFPTKAQAIAFALAWADSHQPCEVLVLGAIGELERNMKFPEGSYRRAHSRDRRRVQVEIPFRDRRQHERRAQ